MASIKFYLQSTKSPAGIYVRLRDGKAIDAKAKTKYSINPSDWSAKKGQPKKNDADPKSLSNKLKDLDADLLKHYTNSIGKELINSEWLKRFIHPATKELQITEKLLEYFDYYVKCKGNELSG